MRCVDPGVLHERPGAVDMQSKVRARLKARGLQCDATCRAHAIVVHGHACLATARSGLRACMIEALLRSSATFTRYKASVQAEARAASESAADAPSQQASHQRQSVQGQPGHGEALDSVMDGYAADLLAQELKRLRWQLQLTHEQLAQTQQLLDIADPHGDQQQRLRTAGASGAGASADLS